jgi:transcription initiation factor TFIIH subunit 4
MTSLSLFNFISTMKNHRSLFTEPIFAISLLRLLDSETTALVFELTINSLHIASLKTIPNAKEIINNLLSLSLINKSGNNVFLDPNFRKSLLLAFTGCDLSKQFQKQQSDQTLGDSIKNISETKFRTILESIVSNINIDHLFGVKEILYFSKLVDREGQITNKGFEFLLKNKKEQLWFLAVNSISYFSKDSIQESSFLLDLMELVMKNNLELCCSEKWESFYSFLDSLGIIVLVNRKVSKNSDLTQFIVNTAELFDQNNLANKKFISLETNFKIYAYTSRSYEKSVLSLFSKTCCTLPNLIKAVFDEESIINAFSKGITSKQIVKYLQDYCENVPKNIINQITIWEQKQHRIRIRNGFLYHDFIHMSDFNGIVRFLEAQGSLIYKDENRRVIVAEERTHEEVKEFIAELNR